MSGWTWQYESADGVAMHGKDLPTSEFPSQADAESWVGEAWQDLLEQGVDGVTLLHDGQQVYGPMSLRPVE